MSERYTELSDTSCVAHGPNPQGNWHALLEHSASVATRAATFAGAFGAGEAAQLLGFWHDAGKVNADWQDYLRASVAGHRQKGPEHAIVGCKILLDALSEKHLWMLAVLVDCHHRGLQDVKVDLKRRVQHIQKHTWIKVAAQQARLLMEKDFPLQVPFLPSFLDMRRKDQSGGFALAWRMLHSCLVDADCLDTEAHYQPETALLRQLHLSGGASSLEVPEEALNAAERIQVEGGANTPSLMSRLFQRLQASQQEIACKPQDASPLQEQLHQHRQVIYQDALKAAVEKPGFFSMTVPTGGGKTRSAMAFALAHAIHHQLRRVIVAIPYTSIIEQNAAVYRELFGEDCVLEHHSQRQDVSPLSTGDDPEDEAVARERWQRLAAENWEAPIIVTTNVQLFESLFSCKNSRLRKLHRIPRSVIILDEVQMLPTKLLSPTLDALRFLVEDFGCSVIFCTATQPAFSANTLAASKARPLPTVREIVAEPLSHFQALQRVQFHLPSKDAGPSSFRDLADNITEAPRSLTILNTIQDARSLLEHLDGVEGVFHLSSRLCPIHRSLVLHTVRHRLRDEGVDCRLISTQVVEAGVDIDFPCVYRVMGPLDSLVQAAGRCNREGRLVSGDVHLVTLQGSHLPKGIYATATALTESLLQQSSLHELSDPGIFQRYFHKLYGSTVLDAKDICAKERELAFASSAAAYQLIPEQTQTVFLHPDDFLRAVENLCQQMEAFAPRFLQGVERAAEAALEGLHRMHQGYLVPSRSWLRVLQPFALQLYQYHFQQAEQRQLLESIDGEIFLWKGRYDELLGLVDQSDSTQLIFS
ncbi:MAG: CRISPR-associated helicase Cas3' [Myxococcales bacterium]|nr:CRISPR-associated helicase Cas3' [Myxococcales bacterium]